MDWIGKRDAFTNNSRNLGVPCLLRGAAIQQRVSDLNVYASANTGVHTGLHLETGNLEFWGWDYIQANARAVPNARDDLYDHGDQISFTNSYGSMQLHNFDIDGAGPGAAAETIFAYNGWGTAVQVDSLGIGSNPRSADSHPDYTFAANSLAWNVRRLVVLVKTDVDSDGLPDAWERSKAGGLELGSDADSDDDGATNFDEYVAGTDPLSSASRPKIELYVDQLGQLVLSFETVQGRLYDIESKEDLSDSTWAVVQSGLVGDGHRFRFSGRDLLPAAYYRYRVRQP